MRKLLIAILVVIAAGACSSSGPHRTSGNTEIYVRQIGSIFFGDWDSAPVTLEVDVTNLSREPLKLRRITIASSATGTYTIDTMSRMVNELVEPRARHTVRLFGSARTRYRNPQTLGPLNVRVLAEFEGAEGRHFQEFHYIRAEVGSKSGVR